MQTFHMKYTVFLLKYQNLSEHSASSQERKDNIKTNSLHKNTKYPTTNQIIPKEVKVLHNNLAAELFLHL